MNTFLDRFNKLEKNECWYITKHPLDFSTLCYAVLILEEYQKKGKIGNLEDFFEEKSKEYKISKNYRMLNNAYYFGLMKKGISGSKYEEAQITEVFFKIKKLCNSNFTEKNLYSDIIVEQLEKIYITTYLDRESDNLRDKYDIYITFAIYKFILSIGDYTREYSISREEFQTFVGTTQEYQGILNSIIGILKFREDSSFKSKIKEVNSKFNGNRFNKMIENHPFFMVTQKKIKLNSEYINIVREKIFQFEKNLSNLLVKNKIDLLTNVGSIFNFIENRSSNPIKKINKPFNRIVYGAPGTGKSYLLNSETTGNSKTKGSFPKTNVERVTFYPGYTYNQFIGGYKPKPIYKDEDKVYHKGIEGEPQGYHEPIITYTFVPGELMRLLIKSFNNPKENFCLIIEEINRVKVDSVFGDFFQLLDRDLNGKSEYVLKCSEEMTSYIKKEIDDNTLDVVTNGVIYLPSNFYIWATMNSADQGVYPMDTAFKRRWDFEYLPLSILNNDLPFSNYKVKLSKNKNILWDDLRIFINNKLKSIVPEDRLIAPYFVKEADFKNDFLSPKVLINKVIMYIKDDVLRHRNVPGLFYKENVSFNDLYIRYNNGEGKNIFNESLLDLIENSKSETE